MKVLATIFLIVTMLINSMATGLVNCKSISKSCSVYSTSPCCSSSKALKKCCCHASNQENNAKHHSSTLPPEFTSKLDVQFCVDLFAWLFPKTHFCEIFIVSHSFDQYFNHSTRYLYLLFQRFNI